ncbi:MAG: hypothetical protein KF849_15350 [Rhizobiaceae bacterium]|nr:hypothetical protein [Rhizobiaceae bacterium]
MSLVWLQLQSWMRATVGAHRVSIGAVETAFRIPDAGFLAAGVDAAAASSNHQLQAAGRGDL